MSCRYCTSGGWHGITCQFCGTGSQADVVLKLATHEGSNFPYVTVALCRSCFCKHSGAAGLYKMAVESRRGITDTTQTTP